MSSAIKHEKLSRAERTRELTVKTLEKLDELNLASTPELYELWYRYFDGEPEVVRAIDKLKDPSDEAACLAIHDRFLNGQAAAAEVSQVSGKVQNSISELVKMLKETTDTATGYGTSLEGASKKIEKAKTLDDLGDVVSEIVTETKAMVQKNKDLETQLVTSSQQVTQLTEHLETVRKEATTDSLTEISNRKAFDARLQECVKEAESKQEPLVLMMLDIDHFKKFNDTYGHPTGDQVLKLVARTLVGNIKGQDMAARYGGEEFSVILPGTTLESGMIVAEKLRASIEAREIVNRATGKNLGAITISIGVAQHKADEEVLTFIERADAALYEAKNAGRNRAVAAK